MKKVISMLLVTATLICGVTAYTSITEKQAKVYYKSITASLDNAFIGEFKDSYGRVREPFVYDNSVYVPIRCMSEHFGKSVSWDEATNHVTLTSNESNYVKESATITITFDNKNLMAFSDGTIIYCEANQGFNKEFVAKVTLLTVNEMEKLMNLNFSSTPKKDVAFEGCVTVKYLDNVAFFAQKDYADNFREFNEMIEKAFEVVMPKPLY